MTHGLLRFLRLARRRPPIALGIGILCVAGLMALFPDVIAPFPPEELGVGQVLLPPSTVHLFGTDSSGFDIFSRVVWAARVDLRIAITSTLVAMFVGTLAGAWAGFHFGRTGIQAAASDLLVRSMDALQAFPVFVLALALVAAAGRDVQNVIYALIVVEIPIFLRLTRSAVLRTRGETYIDAARCAGVPEWRTLLAHVLPNSLIPALTNASVVAGTAVLLTAGLSYVGAGVPAPTAEWGYMVAVGAPNLYTGQWWPALFPGIFMGVVVLGFALVGEGAKEFLDVRER